MPELSTAGVRAARVVALAISTALVVAGPARAQDLGTLNPKPLAPLANPDDPNNPARELFGRKTTPAQLNSESIGFYAKGCLAGGEDAADQRPDLAGHAPLAESQLGASVAHPLP